jgi:hypothetical protein
MSNMTAVPQTAVPQTAVPQVPDNRSKSGRKPTTPDSSSTLMHSITHHYSVNTSRVTSLHLVLSLLTFTSDILNSPPICVGNKIRNELQQRRKVQPLSRRKSKLKPEVVNKTTHPCNLHGVDPAWE